MESSFTALLLSIQSWFAALLPAAGQAFLPDQPGSTVCSLSFLATLGITAVVVVLLLTLTGLPVLCLAAEARAVRGSGFYDKCSRQLTAQMLRLSWTLLLAAPVLVYVREGLSTSLPLLLWLGVVLAQAIFATLYAVCWIRRSSRALRAVPGVLAAVTALLAMYALLLPPPVPGTGGEAADLSAALRCFLPPQETAFWSTLAQLPFLALSLAGGAGAVWLLYRRRRDDFGRDYYTAMISWCARRAYLFWMLLWLLLAGGALARLQAAPWHVPPAVLTELSLAIVPWLLPALLWAPVLYSPVPLRHKLMLVLGLLAALAYPVRLALLVMAHA